MWGRLDEPPGVGLLNGSTTRGDPELAVDGFDLRSYRAWGDVEALRHLPGGELADEEAKHIELTLRELPVELPLPRLARAELPSFALQKLREYACIGIPLQHGPRLAQHVACSAAIAAFGAHPREREQPYEGRPGAHTRQAHSGR